MSWDPYYRYMKEQERMQWDPWFRYWREQDRLQWDPFYRYLKETERRQWDSEYRWQKYEEKRMGSQWLEAYHENPMDPILRQRYEMLYGRRQNEHREKKRREFMESGLVRSSSNSYLAPVPTSQSSSLSGEQTQTAIEISNGINLETAGSRYVPYTSSEDLPSLAAVLAEGIIPPAITWFFVLAMYFGWGSASPLALGLLFMFVAMFTGAVEAKRATALLLIYSVPLLLLEPWIIGDPQTVQMARFNALFKAAIILSIIGAIYVAYWWNRIREEG